MVIVICVVLLLSSFLCLIVVDILSMSAFILFVFTLFANIYLLLVVSSFLSFYFVVIFQMLLSLILLPFVDNDLLLLWSERWPVTVGLSLPLASLGFGWSPFQAV